MDELNKKRIIKIIRIILLGMASIFLIISFFAEEIGIDSQPGWGLGEIIALVLGILFLIIGFRIEKFPLMYRSTAILLLSTLLLFLLLELFSAAILTLYFSEDKDRTSAFKMEYYSDKDWSGDYWNEHFNSGYKKYVPYVEWKREAYNGKYINIDENGIRKTYYSDCDSSAYKIFFFGGSTMWGWGAPDSLTIPSLTAKKLEEIYGKNFCVQNFGEDSYLLIQNMIDLINQLQIGNIPDMVIFYNGVNEAVNSYMTLSANDHLLVEEFKEKLIIDAADIFVQTNTLRLIKNLKTGSEVVEKEIPGWLADEVSKHYFNNYKSLSGIAEQYGFKILFFWQPALLVGEKKLDSAEESVKASLPGSFKKYFNELYSLAAEKSKQYKNIHFLVDSFDSVSAGIYMDTAHMSPVGNEIIADIFVRQIKNKLNN